MRIPARFKLANRTWSVRFDKRMKKVHGDTNFDKCVIRLSDRLREDEPLLLHTFVHELLHATSGTMGWSRVNNDEDRIDALAGLICQLLDTMEGEAR